MHLWVVTLPFIRAWEEAENSFLVMSQGSPVSWSYSWATLMSDEAEYAPQDYVKESMWRSRRFEFYCVFHTVISSSVLEKLRQSLKWSAIIKRILSVSDFVLAMPNNLLQTVGCVPHWSLYVIQQLIFKLLNHTGVNEGWIEYDRWALVSDSCCGADEFRALYCG